MHLFPVAEFFLREGAPQAVLIAFLAALAGRYLAQWHDRLKTQSKTGSRP